MLTNLLYVTIFSARICHFDLAMALTNGDSITDDPFDDDDDEGDGAVALAQGDDNDDDEELGAR